MQEIRQPGEKYSYAFSRYVEPMLRARGLSDAEIRVLRVDNPRRMLAGPE